MYKHYVSIQSMLFPVSLHFIMHNDSTRGGSVAPPQQQTDNFNHNIYELYSQALRLFIMRCLRYEDKLLDNIPLSRYTPCNYS